MSSKEFCKNGEHTYKETDIVRSIFDGALDVVWIVVACSKCDSKFLKVVEKPLP